ncbi:thyrotropin-releasing hormone receptor [Plakobranchus ocellatus]|uniref:Thyrotropin-releasing hormone receptor n=1 Tax=Plakobranchus ocellatus TaxID=259542 RepID=A0AAV4DJ72_9GAST|nr:thyrotropin-releasing hormone receptor [Plakobranchus ocellatus]
MQDTQGTAPFEDMATRMTVTSKESSYAWLAAVNNFNARYSIPVLVVVGIAGNLLALIVFLCSPLRRITTSLYLASQSLTDLLFLIFLGINWLASIQIDVFALPGLCQTLVFVTYEVSFLSLWMIVALTLDLYASIKWHCLHRRISRPSRAICICAGLVLFGCGIYAFSFWLTTTVHLPGKQAQCLHNGDASLAIAGAVIDSALTLIVPFCLLIYMNVHILYVIASLAKSGAGVVSRKSRERRLNPQTLPGPRTGIESVSVTDQETSDIKVQSSRQKSQTSALSSTSPKHERFPRKRVSFEDEGRISIQLEDEEIIFDQASGRLLVVAKIVVSNEITGLKLDTLTPAPFSQCMRQQRSLTVSDRRRPSTGGARNRRPSFPPRRFSVSTPIKRVCMLRKSSANETNKSKDRFQTHPLLKRQQTRFCRIAASKDWQEKRKSSGKQRDSMRRRLVQTPIRKRFRHRSSHSPLTKLQCRCFRMVLTVAIVFLCLNVPSHTIRLQSLIHSLLDPSYRPSELEFQLQSFLQFFYYLNFVANVFIYSACTRNFRTACVNIPWHVSATVRHLLGMCTIGKAEAASASNVYAQNDADDNSRHVEICLNEIHLSEIPPPTNKPITPPCLISQGPPTKKDTDRRRSSLAIAPA